jgi:plastocyanin
MGRTIVVTVTGNKVSPAPATVDLGVGEKLTLTVTSDHADQLHIHGFEVEKDLVAGKPLSVTVTGEQPGVYEVETHHPELRLLKIAVK